MAETSIEWTDRTVNPIRFGRGHYCQRVSPGCKNCYAAALQWRFGNPDFPGSGAPPPAAADVPPGMPADVREDILSGRLWLDESKLLEVLGRRKPTRYFWADMTDLFGSWVPDGWLDRCFAVMALTPQHTHQVLTKRADRLADYLAAERRPWEVFTAVNAFCDHPAFQPGWAACHVRRPDVDAPMTWPLPNLHVGVSVEDQPRADQRIWHLLRSPAAVRFLSCEPLLGPVRLDYLRDPDRPAGSIDALRGIRYGKRDEAVARVGWVIVGGESGRGSRECHVQWVRSIVRQCRAAGVPVFVKQLGANAWSAESGDAAELMFPDGVPANVHVQGTYTSRLALPLAHPKGGDPAEWPEDLRVREFPEAPR